MKHAAMLLIAIFMSLLSCGDNNGLEDGIYAKFVTNHGTMTAELYYKETPATVANFVALAEGNHPMADSVYAGKPYYDGLTFHRILDDFVIQGGDPQGNGRGGPGYKFHDEITEYKHDTIGILSMANGGPATNGSQFFITDAPTPWLDGKHTVWGKLVSGYDVLEKITKLPLAQGVDPRAGKPADSVIIEKVTIIRNGTEARNFNAPDTFQNELLAEEERISAAKEEKMKKFASVKETFDAQKAQARKLPSGLEIYVTEEGNGPKPKTGQRVLVDYVGYFDYGEIFDTSKLSAAEGQDKVDERKKAAGMYKPLNALYSPEAALAAGFKEGIQELKIGDKATLFVPYYLGYGEQGYPGAIPPRADLIFEVELLEIVD